MIIADYNKDYYAPLSINLNRMLSYILNLQAEINWRSRIASLQKSDLLGLTTPDPTPTSSRSQRPGRGQSLESKGWGLIQY